MKKVLVRAGLLCTIVLVFSTCHKFDWDLFDHHGKNNCDLQSYYLTLEGHAPDPFLFEKKYNTARDRVTEIKFTVFNLTPVEVPYNLRLVYKPGLVYLVNVHDAQDTTLKIYFNEKGRVSKCAGKIDNEYVRFHYDARNRLSIIESGLRAGSVVKNTCEYDSYGNILSITHPQPGQRSGYFYRYDYSKKAKRQVYLDELASIDEFTLLQYLGYFPELEPSHVRTFVRVGLETGSLVWQAYLVNHQLDAKGKLVQYDIANDSTGLNIRFQAKLNWKCK